METSSQIAWRIVPLRHFFPLKVVPLIEVLLYNLPLSKRLGPVAANASRSQGFTPYIMGVPSPPPPPPAAAHPPTHTPPFVAQ
jgi:hypothetical protein